MGLISIDCQENRSFKVNFYLPLLTTFMKRCKCVLESRLVFMAINFFVHYAVVSKYSNGCVSVPSSVVHIRKKTIGGRTAPLRIF